MGGPWSLYENYPWLEPETKLIRRAVETDLPVLGICLGAQLIAAALGANVMPCGSKEIGWYPLKLTAAGHEDPLLSCLSLNETVFQWHGDTFEIPEGAKLLASSPFCDHQAFRYGKSTYALQFHLEVTPFIIEEWLQVPENQAELSALGLTAAEISKGSEIHSQRLQALAECFFDAFLKLG
jgi:GMP synthase-like glutamine amidotransferase